MSKFFGFKNKDDFISTVERHDVQFVYRYGCYYVKKMDNVYCLDVSFIENVPEEDYPKYCYQADSVENLMNSAYMYDGVSFMDAFNKEGIRKYFGFESKEEFLEEAYGMERHVTYKGWNYIFTLDGAGYNFAPTYTPNGFPERDVYEKNKYTAQSADEIVNIAYFHDGTSLKDVLEMDINDIKRANEKAKYGA